MQGVTGTYTHLKNTLWGSRDYFQKRSSPEKVFPFPTFFEQQLRAEWESPPITRRPPATIRKLYSLPKFTEDFLKVPIVDTPILAMQSSGLLSEDGQGSIRDSWDKRIEQDLCQVYDFSSLAIGSMATTSIVARASIVWTKKLLNLIPQVDSRLQEGLSRLLKANAFIADSTLDNTSIYLQVNCHRRSRPFGTVVKSMAGGRQVKTNCRSISIYW